MTTVVPALDHPWARRLPRGVLTVGAPGLVLVGVAASIASTWSDESPVTVAEVSSPGWILYSLLGGGVVAAVILLAVDPHRTILWAPLLVAALAIDETTRNIWAVVTAGLVVMALTDRVGAERQRSIAAAWPVLPAPDLPPEARTELLGRRVIPLALVALCLTGAVVAGGFWLRDAHAAATFRSEAVSLAGEVVQTSDDELSVQVRTSDGREVRVPTPVTMPEVGERVEVLERRTDGRTELVGDPFDPSLVLVPAGAGLVVGAGLLRADSARRRRMRHLLDHGGPGLTLVATALDERWILFRDADGRRLAVVPAQDPTPVLLGPVDRTRPPQDEAEDDWGPEDEAPDLTQMDDDALLAFARTLRYDDDDPGPDAGTDGAAPAAPDGLGAAPRGAFEVRVHGLTSFGDRPLMEILPGSPEVDEGWIEGGAARDRPLDLRNCRFRRDRVASLAERSPGPVAPAPHAPGPGPAERAGDPPSAVGGRPTGSGRTTGAWVPWAVLAAGAGVFLLDPGPYALVGLLWVPGIYGWMTTAHPRVVVGRAGFRVRGAVLDTLVPWTTVRRVLHDDLTVAIRVDPPQDAWFLLDEPELGPVLRGTRDPAAVARRLEQAWLHHRVDGVTRWAPPHLPTPGAAACLLWVGILVAAALAG